MARPKKLSMKKIEQNSKQFNKTTTFTFDDGNTLIYYPLFSPIKVNEVIDEYLNDAEYFRSNEIEIDLALEQSYIALLIVKHFTELKDDISDDPTVKLQQLKKLADSDYLVPMLEDMFDQGEIFKIQDGIMKKLAIAGQIGKMYSQYNDYMESFDIKNRDLMKDAFKQTDVRLKNKEDKDEIIQ